VTAMLLAHTCVWSSASVVKVWINYYFWHKVNFLSVKWTARIIHKTFHIHSEIYQRGLASSHSVDSIITQGRLVIGFFCRLFVVAIVSPFNFLSGVGSRMVAAYYSPRHMLHSEYC